MTGFLLLLVAIASEIVATTSLKLSDGFTRLAPSVLVVLGYGAAFYFLSLTLRQIPLSVTYAIWSGLGTAAMALVGVALFRESLDAPRIVGILLIIAGVVLVNQIGRAHV